MDAGTFRRWLYRLLPGMIAALAASSAAAWTDKPVKFIIPAPPGGAADLAVRAVAEHVAVTIKQAVIVENDPKGVTVIQDVLGAAPNGQMLFVGFPIAARPDLFKELRPVAQIARSKSEPGAWIGVLVAAATPADLIARMNGAIVHSAGTTGVIEQLGALGFAPGLPLTPGPLELSMRAQADRDRATGGTASARLP